MNYKNGKIYAIRSYQTEEIYIGSTTQTLTKRLSSHKRNICNSKLILQYPDAYIELIENFPCNSKEELNRKEGEHIRANNCVNKNIAGRTPEEYRKENKEKIAERTKKDREQNLEKFKERAKRYRKENAEKIKEKNRNYCKENREKVNDYHRKYRQNKIAI